MSSALVKQDNSLEQQTPREYTSKDCKNLARQLEIFTTNKGLSICDKCSKKVEFKELERMNVYSDFLICNNCQQQQNIGVF